MVVFIHLQGAPRKHPAYRQWLKTRSPSDNGGRADNQRHPARPVFVRDFGTELGGNARVIKPDFLLDDAVVPNGMKIEFAWSCDCDKVPAAVIVEGQQRLMNIANPMTQAFEEAELVAHIEAEGQIPRVVQDGGDDAAIGDGARVRNLDPLRGARQIHEMFGRPNARVIGRGARVSEGPELWIDRNKRIDADFG